MQSLLRSLFARPVVLALLLSSCSLATADLGEPVYLPEELAYFSEIAFGAERGRQDEHVRKWTSDVRLQVLGAATPEDSAVVRQVVDEINALIRGVRVLLVDEAPTVPLRFVSRDELARYVAGDCPCFGLAVTKYDTRREIRGADVFIVTEASPAVRAHAIREEITQMLGLMVDSYAYPASIFYQPYSEVSEYAEIDRRLIEMLYRPEVRPGMTRARAMEALAELRR